MLAKEFDPETSRYLDEILQRENMAPDELIKSLIRDRWLSLQEISMLNALPTIEVEVAAPKPKNIKQSIADFVRRKNAQQPTAYEG